MKVRSAHIGFGIAMFAMGFFMLAVGLMPPIQPATAILFCLLAAVNFYNGYSVLTRRG